MSTVETVKFEKSAWEIIDFKLNWYRWLDGAEIQSVSHSFTGLMVDAESVEGVTTRVRISGGSPGQSYDGTAQIVCVDGQQMEVTIRVSVV